MLNEYAINLMEDMSGILAKMGVTQSGLNTFPHATAMCAITRVLIHEDVLNPIQYCKSKLIQRDFDGE